MFVLCAVKSTPPHLVVSAMKMIVLNGRTCWWDGKFLSCPKRGQVSGSSPEHVPERSPPGKRPFRAYPHSFQGFLL